MARKSLLAIGVVFLMTLITVSAWAVPTVINFQGKLTDSDGVSMPDGSYTMRFVIYDDVAPGGTLLWQEDQSVPVADGIYNVQLGYVTVFAADLFDNDALYLEVRVYNQGTSNWETLEPRQQLSSTAFSLKAAKAEDAELLEGFSAGSFVGTGGGTMSGPLSVPSLQIDGVTAFRAPGDNTYVGLSTGSSSGASNTLIGNHSGYQLTTGSRNTFVGKDSGYSTTSGARNVFLGHDAGTNNQNGFENTFVGESAGLANVDGDYNTFIGRYTGRSNVGGSSNTYIGQGAGYYSPAGDENVFVGIFAGQGNSTGSRNTFLGSYAGEGNGDSMENTFVGYRAGDQGGGDYNTCVGAYAGYLNTAGNRNVFLGHKAGYNETGSDKLYIANSDTSTPLIHGDFQAQELTVNGKLTVSGGVKFADGTVQTTAPAPTWHQILPADDGDPDGCNSSRFKCAMGGAAVLDMETGLVWQKSPFASTEDWYEARFNCWLFPIGGRKGWRLPTIEELNTLVDPAQSNPALPNGHPFVNVQSNWYWSSNTLVNYNSEAMFVDFSQQGGIGSGSKSNSLYYWCVRGGQGYDAY